MVDILSAVLTDGLSAVEAACAEALGQGVHSADVVLNILARKREPENLHSCGHKSIVPLAWTAYATLAIMASHGSSSTSEQVTSWLG
jgi:hypothetical protein